MPAVGRFVSAAARARHRQAYTAAMTTWPAHTTRTVETSYGPTGVQVARRGGTGLPVVALHGLSATAAQWAPNAGAWVAARDVYAVDAICDPGSSRQTAPVTGGAAMAHWLDQVLEGLGLDRVHLVGFSYGAWVGINQAVRSPGHLATLTALDPAAGFARLRPRFWWTMARSLLGTTPAQRFGWILDDNTPAELWELFAASRGFRPARMPAPRVFSLPELAHIHLPVLTVLGSDSVVTQAAAIRHRLRQAVPHAQVEVVTARHGVPLDNPEETNRLTSAFWAAHD